MTFFISRTIAVVFLVLAANFANVARAADPPAAKLRIIVFGAHPDDAEFKTGGTAAKWYGPERGKMIKYAEAFEICEYGRRPSPAELKQLFPFFEP